VLQTLPAGNAQTIVGHEFFPDLIAGPFHHGLTVVFLASTLLALLAAAASLSRGRRSVTPQPAADPLVQSHD
jgi:hypothetical protein